MNGLWWLVATAILTGMGILLIGRYFRLWLMAYASGARVGLLRLILMSLRKVDPYVIVQCRVMTRQAGLPDVPVNALEAQYLAGGQVHRVILALIAAQRSGIELDWCTAAAIDLAGRDILEAVQVSVNPKVIYCPDPTAGADATLHGVAQDGIQVRVRARVTVRTNLAQLIGGATEATVIARVGQGIVAAIGACTTFRQALADPQMISRQVISDGLDSQTAFAIVSIDIAEIAVGANIGARLQVDQAEADLRVARAAAERRRAMAQAELQEMQALTREHQATAVLAEVDLNLAVAAAFNAGHFRVHGMPAPAGAPRDAARLRAASSSAASRSRETPATRRGQDAPTAPFGTRPS